MIVSVFEDSARGRSWLAGNYKSKEGLIYYFTMFGSQPELIITTFTSARVFSFFLVPSFSRHPKVISLFAIYADLAIASDDVSRRLINDEIDYRASSKNTDDLQAWLVARQWLNNCLAKHSSCGTSTTGSKYPTRLIFISPVDTAACRSADIRLQISADEPPHGPYVTLSHCWGKSQIPTLTKKNLESMQSTICFKSLPRTFQDAILFTRFCGIQYLWIDSLCIIQDSEDDWNKESKTMASVYKRSHCNINATASEDSHGGCFFPREPMLVDPLRVYLNGKDQCTLASGDYICASGTLWMNNVDFAPLSTRAWVLQEHLLSPRHLHCGRRQLFWHCRKHRACETFPHAMPTYRDEDGLVRTIRDDRLFFNNSLWGDVTDIVPAISDILLFRYGQRLEMLQKFVPPEYVSQQRTMDCNANNSMDQAIEATTRRLYVSWRSLVAEYSLRALTKKRDKLLAISGIISYIESATDDQNCAGLWQNHLHEEILWKVDKDIEVIRPQGEAPVIPSWSWASVNGAIKPYFEGHKTNSIYVARLSFIDNRIVEDGVSSKKCFQAEISYQIRMRCFLYHGFYNKHIDVSDKHSFRLHVEAESYVLDLGSQDFDQDSYPESRVLALAPIIQSTRKGRRVFDVLLLESTGGHIYRRVGMLQLYDDDWHSPLSRLSKAIDKSMKDHPEQCIDITLT